METLTPRLSGLDVMMLKIKPIHQFLGDLVLSDGLALIGSYNPNEMKRKRLII